jgi:hypothetical protein
MHVMHVRVQNKSTSHAHETRIEIQEVILFFITNKGFKNYAKDCLSNQIFICYHKIFDKRWHLICDCIQQFNRLIGQIIFKPTLLAYNNDL